MTDLEKSIQDFADEANRTLERGAEWKSRALEAEARIATLEGALREIKKMKPKPISDTGFQQGPLALFNACQRIARAALAAGAGEGREPENLAEPLAKALASLILAKARSAELEASVARLEGALREIAAFNDVHANDFLKSYGSYRKFDEPGSVEIARTALAAGAGEEREPENLAEPLAKALASLILAKAHIAELEASVARLVEALRLFRAACLDRVYPIGHPVLAAYDASDSALAAAGAGHGEGGE